MKYIISLLLAFVTLSVTAQELPERGEVRRGNKAYLQEDYAAAAESYTKAMTYSPSSFEPRFNLGNALLKGERIEESEKLFTQIAADSLLGDQDRAEAYYNLGNTQFQQQKLQEALESYKNSIRFDPNDQEAKYNYAYTKAMLDQNDQNQDQQQQDDQNQENQDQNEDQQDQDQNNDDQNQDDQQQDQQDQDDQGGGEDDQDDQGEQPQDQQPQEGQMSDQQQQQMLDAVQAQEDKTQDDLKERARGVVVPGAKNW